MVYHKLPLFKFKLLWLFVGFNPSKGFNVINARTEELRNHDTANIKEQDSFINQPKKIKLPRYTCKRCGHSWIPRSEKKGPTRVSPKNEMFNKKWLFRSAIIRSSPASTSQADAIKFYTLTDFARAVLPSFRDSLSEVSTHLEEIKR